MLVRWILQKESIMNADTQIKSFKGIVENYAGIKIFPNEHLTEIAIKEIAKTWKERLWSRPWHPFQKMKTKTYQIPLMQPIIYDDHTWFAHPERIEKLEKI